MQVQQKCDKKGELLYVALALKNFEKTVTFITMHIYPRHLDLKLLVPKSHV